MSSKVSIADIANALGLSRNTVSKALNGSPGITHETRQRILDQAVRMNYKMMGTQLSVTKSAETSSILLVCKDNQLVNTFFGPLILQLQHIVRTKGAVITMQYMSPEEMEAGIVPSQIYSASGVIGLEILDSNYIRHLVNCGKPCVFFDCAIDADEISTPFDVVLQDERGLYTAIDALFKKGYTRFGFVGDPNHCAGFRNRYDYFRLALADHGQLEPEKYSILHSDETMHQPGAYLQSLKTSNLPEMYVCANDTIACNLLKAMQEYDATSPEKIGIIVFEMSHEMVAEDKLMASVNLSRKQIASGICMLLFDRIQNPTATKRIIKLESLVEVF